MPNRFDPKIVTIMQALSSRGFTLKGIRQGIRLKLEHGIDIDIYTLKVDASKLRVRLKLPVDNEEERARIINDAGERLRDGLEDVSEMEDFQFSRCISGNYFYYARLFMLDPKIKTIMQVMHSRGFPVKAIKQGIRLKLSGTDVDIYALKFDASKLRVRLKLPVEEEAERIRVIQDVSATLRDGLGNSCDMADFSFSRCVSGNYYYYARLFMLDPDIVVTRIPYKKAVAPNDADKEKKADLENAVNIFESVDAKMFREAMDGLGVPRTSILRVSFARIFRAATDPEELQTAIREEAARISDPRDRSDLDTLLASNKVEFLEPIIKGLHRSIFDESAITPGITDY